jgi:hypothetical protein
MGVMTIEDADDRARTVRLVATEAELALVANALNEVCNGVHISDPEFATRLGAQRDVARALLVAAHEALDALSPRPR